MNSTGKGYYRPGPDPRRHDFTQQERSDGRMIARLREVAIAAWDARLELLAWSYCQEYNQRRYENWQNRRRKRVPEGLHLNSR